MCDVVFVVPAIKPVFKYESVGTLILASLLKQKGVKVEIHRFFEVDDSDYYSFIEKSAEAILARNPKIVSFYCRCDYYLAMVRIAQQIKKLKEDIYIVFGGPQADAAAIPTMQAMPWVDYCCSGEGETTVYPLFSALLSGADPTATAGLTYRKGTDIIQNPRPPMLQNMDDSPRIDYSLVPEKVMERLRDSKEAVSMDIGRGCPFNCTYCSTSLFWQRKFRLKSNERILDEMLELYEKFGVSRFNFTHDLFTGSKARILDFCEKLKQRNLPFEWMCSSRIDTVDEEMIAAMAAAGMCGIYFGVESGSERIQKLIKKNLKPQQAFQTVCLAKKYNVHTTVSFIYGFPEETDDDVSKTLALAFRMKEAFPDIREQFHLCAIFHGSEMFRTYFDELTFAPVQSNEVNDFGLKENLNFVLEHKDVFPHYYEYTSPLRTKLAELEKFMSLCLSMYSVTRFFLPVYTPDRLIDLYYDFMEINGSVAKTLAEKYAALQAFARARLPEERADVVCELIRFEQERMAFMREDEPICFKQYNADVRAYLAGAEPNAVCKKNVQVGMHKENGKCKISVL